MFLLSHPSPSTCIDLSGKHQKQSSFLNTWFSMVHKREGQTCVLKVFLKAFGVGLGRNGLVGQISHLLMLLHSSIYGKIVE